jgi:hypothetical protein
MAEQELVVRAVDLGRETEVRVVGEIGRQGNEYTYGVAFVNERLDFWKMEFPPAAQWRPDLLTLECGGCKAMVELMNGDFEYNICAIHGGLARFCEGCGMLTVWRQSHELMPAPAPKVKKVEAAPVVVAEKAVEIVAVAEAVEASERRGRVRAKVNFFACVRAELYGDDVVKCIVMSKGGVSFRSRNFYKKETAVEIAVPFSAEVRDAPAIFVQGKIAYGKEAGEWWRCGVEFVR